MLPKNKLWAGLSSLVLAAVSPAVFAEWGLNMSRGITDISRETYSLHMQHVREHTHICQATTQQYVAYTKPLAPPTLLRHIPYTLA